jgi:hypothetical protein
MSHSETTSIQPSLRDLKTCLGKPTIALHPSKRKWLIDNAPAHFTYPQALLLAYVNAKLLNNPAIRWEQFAKRSYRATDADILLVNAYHRYGFNAFSNFQKVVDNLA